MAFKEAVRAASPLKLAFQGASGSGKTWTALAVATALRDEVAPGTKIALIDTEGGSATRYTPPFKFDMDDDFGAGTNKAYTVDSLLSKLEWVKNSGSYGVVVIDNMTHFWKEAGGLMSKIDEEVARMKARGNKPDSFAAWKSIDPIYRRMMNYIRTFPLHIIMTVRAKQAYEKSSEGGKGSLKKIGVEPEFRDGFEYEVDAQFAIDMDHVCVPLKQRFGEVLDNKVFNKPGKDLAHILADWYASGAPGQVIETPTETPTTTPPKDVIAKMEAVRAPSSAELTEKHIKEFKALGTSAALEKYAHDVVKVDVDAKRITQDDYRKITHAFMPRRTELKAAEAAADAVA